MKKTILIFCLALLPTQARAGEIASRAFALQARSLVEGLTGVAASAGLSVRDRQILRIMAQMEGDVLAAAVLGPEPAGPCRPLRAVRGSRPDRGGSAEVHNLVPLWSTTWGYTVTFENQTSEDLDEVVIFWQRKVPTSLAMRESRAPFPAHSYYPFVLGRCDELGSYTIGVFLNGKRIFKIPSEANMSITPEIASRFNTRDNDPCGDSWTLHEQ